MKMAGGQLGESGILERTMAEDLDLRGIRIWMEIENMGVAEIIKELQGTKDTTERPKEKTFKARVRNRV